MLHGHQIVKNKISKINSKMFMIPQISDSALFDMLYLFYVMNCFRDVMLEYTKHVMTLGEFLFELLSEALGLDPNHLNEMDCSKGLLMLNHYYPPCPEPDLTLGTSQH